MINPRLPLAFALTMCMLLIVGLFGLHTINAVNASFDPLVEGTVPRLLALQEIQSSAARLSVDIIRHIYHDHGYPPATLDKHARLSPRENRSCEEALARFETALEAYQALNPPDPPSVAINKAGVSLLQLARNIGDLADTGKGSVEIAPRLTELKQVEEQLHIALDQTIIHELANLEAESARADQRTRARRVGSIGITGVALLLAGATGFMVSHQVEAARQNDEQRFRGVIQQSLDGFSLVNANGKIVEWNEGAERLTGLLRDDVHDETIWDVQYRLLPEEMRTPLMRQQLKETFGHLLETGSAPWIGQLIERQIVRPDGSERIIQTVTSPIQDSLPILIGSVIRDVTEQSAAHEEILQRNKEIAALLSIGQQLATQIELEELLTTIVQAVVDTLPTAEAASLWLTDPENGRLVVRAAVGYPDGDMCNLSIPVDSSITGWILGCDEVQLIDTFSQSPLLKLREGPDWVEPQSTVGVPILMNGLALGVLFADNFSGPSVFDAEALRLLQVLTGQAGAAIQNSQYVANLKEQHAELQRLSAQLASIREDECRRISRELHDEIGQALIAASINLSTILSVEDDLHSDTRRRLNETAALIEQILGEVREMSLELHPAILDDLGLASALRWYLKKWGRRVSLCVERHIQEIDRQIPQDLQTALYRLVQEALTNVAKHSKASRVRVSLKQEENDLFLCIVDDGQGFGAGQKSRGEGLGLIGMRERITEFNGQLAIESQLGRGTNLTVRVPLQQPTRERNDNDPSAVG